MSDKLPQTQAELEEHLQEHLQFLESSAKAFDAGCDGEAKRLAVSIRVLLHDTQSSHSLLGQLNQKDIDFYDTSFDYDPDNLATHGGLVAISMGPKGTQYVAMLDNLPMEAIPQLKFEEWWNKPVFVDQERHQLTRKQLVLAIANQDGGAHVDPGLDETYAKLSRHNSLGWMISTDGGEQPMAGPERAAIRQVAHEVLKSLKPGYTKTPDLGDQAIFTGATLKVEDVPVPSAPQHKRIKVGRNDSCPCGSGKKYKKCCGK